MYSKSKVPLLKIIRRTNLHWRGLMFRADIAYLRLCTLLGWCRGSCCSQNIRVQGIWGSNTTAKHTLKSNCLVKSILVNIPGNPATPLDTGEYEAMALIKAAVLGSMLNCINALFIFNWLRSCCCCCWNNAWWGVGAPERTGRPNERLDIGAAVVGAAELVGVRLADEVRMFGVRLGLKCWVH